MNDNNGVGPLPDFLAGISGDQLSLKEYQVDFAERFWQIENNKFWKLERQQTFREPGNPAWEAFDRGHIKETLELLEQERPKHLEQCEKMTRQGFSTHRVRVVTEPFSSYLAWELHALRIQQQCGKSTRIVPSSKISSYEQQAVLPEVVVLGTNTLYQVLYDESGAPCGGVRSTDRETITRWTNFIKSLYEQGEDLEAFFTRREADLRLIDPVNQP